MSDEPSRKRPSAWDQRSGTAQGTGWDQKAAPQETPASTQTTKLEPPVKKRLVADNSNSLDAMTKSELIAAIKLPKQSFKDLREIAKKLEKYPPINRDAEIDGVILLTELVMKKYPSPQVFVCYRCDRAKTSNMKAKWKGSEIICGSCFDHITRCIIPYRGLPEYQIPERCIHKVPKTYQKCFR